MTLAQCLDEIRMVCLKGDAEKMTSLARKIVSDLKFKHYLGREYPRQGWFLEFSDRNVRIFNKDVSIPLELRAAVVPIRRSR